MCGVILGICWAVWLIVLIVLLKINQLIAMSAVGVGAVLFLITIVYFVILGMVEDEENKKEEERLREERRRKKLNEWTGADFEDFYKDFLNREDD